MTGGTPGIAHVSFTGGGIFVPARTPYDRQMLIEHVVDRVRSKGQVQVSVDNQRWLVHLVLGLSTARCWSCGNSADAVCYPTACGEVVYCVRCALSGREHIAGLPDRSEAAHRNGTATVQSQDDAA